MYVSIKSRIVILLSTEPRFSVSPSFCVVNSIVLPTKCLQHALAWMCSRSAGFSCMPFVYHIAYWDVRYGSCARVRRSKRSRNQMQEAMDTCSFATRDQGRCFIVRRTLRPDRTSPGVSMFRPQRGSRARLITATQRVANRRTTQHARKDSDH
jgi:hypothetical protein